MSVAKSALDVLRHDAESHRQYRRDPRWSGHPAYTMEDVSGGFRATESLPQHMLPNVWRTRVLSAFMLLFPLAVLGYMGVLALLVGVGIDGVRLGTAFDHPGLASGAVLLVALSMIILMRLIYRIMADWRRRYVAVVLRKQEFPVLHRFVAKVAERVDGPVPDIITVDNEVGLVLRQRSRAGLRQLELVIGLPLLYALSARQLSGLIAHAYGGSSRTLQGFGYPLMENINRWLVRMGEGEAARTYDDSQSSWSMRLIHPIDWVISTFFASLCRTASVLSFSISRRMDVQGDRHSARLAGATEFRATQIRLRALQLGKIQVMSEWRASENFDSLNMARRIAAYADVIQAERRHQLVDEMETLVSPFTRSRVVDLERIVDIERSQDEGMCFLMGSALRLVPHIDGVAEQLGAKWRGAHGHGL